MQTYVITSQQGSRFNTRLKLALTDLKQGILNWPVWLLLAWQDIKLRYRRSMLGPFWITISMAVTIGMTGFLYGSLFHFRLKEYFPLFASGMLIWSFISAQLNESTHIFADAEHFLKQIKLPFSVFLFKNIAKNFIIFLHNIVIFIPIIFIFHLPINFFSGIALLGLLLLLINAFTIGMILAIIGTRYRDLTQVVASLTQVFFFLTPIIWVPAMLPKSYQFAVYLNPIAQFIEMIRNPLMGLPPSLYAVCMTVAVTLISFIIAFYIFARFRARIAYWL